MFLRACVHKHVTFVCFSTIRHTSIFTCNYTCTHLRIMYVKLCVRIHYSPYRVFYLFWLRFPAVCIFLLFFGRSQHLSVSIKISKICITSVSPQAIKLNSCARRQTTAGEMVNLMSVDAQRLMELMTNLNLMWSAPLQITMATYFLYDVMGVSVLAGVAVLLLMIPLNLVVTRICRRLQVCIPLSSLEDLPLKSTLK